MQKRFLKALCLLLTLSLLFNVGCDGGSESSAVSFSDEKRAVKINGEDFYIDFENSVGDGLCLLEYGFDDSENIEKSFSDAVIIDGTVVEISENKKLYIPENGYLLRLVGEENKLSVGDTVAGLGIKSQYEKFVTVGNKEYEISLTDEDPLSEPVCAVFDNYWYTGYTCTSSNRVELSVDAENKAVKTENGSATIPDGGFVVSALSGTSLAKALSDTKAGENIFVTEKSYLYKLRRINITGKNKTRPASGITLFDEGDTTPICDNCLEIAVDKDGNITDIYENDNAINEIPEGGFIISVTGDFMSTVSRYVAVGKKIYNNKNSLFILDTPDTKLKELKNTLLGLSDTYNAELSKLSHIDFEKAHSFLSEAEALIKGYENGETAENLIKAEKLIKDNASLLIPSVRIGDRAAWITVAERWGNDYHKHYRSADDVKAAVAFAKNVGLNTLIVENCSAGYSVYPSEVEGMCVFPGLDFDVLAAFRDECEKQDITFIIMVGCFAGGYNGVAFPENHYMNLYKDKYLITNKGSAPDASGYITLDPADKDIQAFELAIIKELAEKYSPDAIQLDYIRYPLPITYGENNYEDYGYNGADKAGFIKEYGKDPTELKITDALWEKWCEHRADIITSFLRDARQTVRDVDENIKLSVTCFAERDDRKKFVYQQVEKWLSEDLADSVYPMIYASETDTQRFYAEQIKTDKIGGKDIVLGIGTYVKATDKAIKEMLYMPYELGYEGSSTFTLRYIATCGYTGTYMSAFSTQAVPTTAPKEELVSSAREMLLSRADTFAFLSGQPEELKNFKESVSALLSDFSDYTPDAALSLLKQKAKDLKIHEKYISALEKDLSYLEEILK